MQTPDSQSAKLVDIFKEYPKTVMRKCIEHRKLGWELLKGWDDNSKHNLQVNKQLIERLFQRIEGALSQSYQRYDSMFSFFNQFALHIKGTGDLYEKIGLFRIKKIKEEESPKDQSQIIGGSYFQAMDSFKTSISQFEQKLNENSKNA